MPEDLKETVTVTRRVDGRIADLVHFARSLAGKDITKMTDDDLIKRAHDYWESAHGDEHG